MSNGATIAPTIRITNTAGPSPASAALKSAPQTETATVSADPAPSYIIDIDDDGSQGADGAVVLNGEMLLPYRTDVDMDRAMSESRLRHWRTTSSRFDSPGSRDPGSISPLSVKVPSCRQLWEARLNRFDQYVKQLKAKESES